MNRPETAHKSQESKNTKAQPASCCPTSELASCCEPSAKPGCCGPQVANLEEPPVSCGCR